MPDRFPYFVLFMISPGIEVDFHLILIINALTCLHTFQDRQTDVDRIAVKDTRKAFCDHTGDTACLNGNRCMFTAASATEI